MPSRAQAYVSPFAHLVYLTQYSVARGANLQFHFPQCTPPECNRNLGIEKLHEMNCDEILYIDADQTFPTDLLFRLQSHNKEIVGVNCKRRIPPYNPVITKDILGRPLNRKKNQLVKMEKIGFAATLIQKEVFDAMPNFVFRREILSRSEWIGEDYIFCKAARDAGYHIYCDLELSQQIGHIGDTTHYLDK